MPSPIRKFLSKSALSILLAFCVFSTNTYADEALTQELVQRVTKSTQELNAVQKKIATENLNYAERLDKKQNDIMALRKEAASIQRLADEQLLGLEQLKTRTDQWTTQSNYQNHLLASYVESVGLPDSRFEKKDGEIVITAQTVNIALEEIESLLEPKWKTSEVITISGGIAETQTLAIGPIEVAYDQTSNSGGLLSRATDNEARVLDIYSRTDLAQLELLLNSGKGTLSFDPTLGNAFELLNQNDGLVGHIAKGGVWALPILFFGFLSFIIALLKGIQLIRLPKVDSNLAGKLEKITKATSSETKQGLSTAYKEAAGAQKKIIKIAASTPASQQRDDLLVAFLMEYKHSIEQYLGIIATSAAIAPLLGLLGTVSGMINTFKMMTIFGSGDASTVSGGISEALVTTELGLIVAIPSLIVSALLSRKTKSYTHKLETFAIKISKIKFQA